MPTYTRIEEGRGLYTERRFKAFDEAISELPLAPMSRVVEGVDVLGARVVAEAANGPLVWVDADATLEEIGVIDQCRTPAGPLRTRLGDLLDMQGATDDEVVTAIRSLKIQAEGTGAALREIADMLDVGDAWAPDEVTEAVRTEQVSKVTLCAQLAAVLGFPMAEHNPPDADLVAAAERAYRAPTLGKWMPGRHLGDKAVLVYLTGDTGAAEVVRWDGRRWVGHGGVAVGSDDAEGFSLVYLSPAT